jgi:O-antigen/teichoic acid export membrane protein
MLKRVLTGMGANVFEKFIIAFTQIATVPLLAHTWGLSLYGLWVMLSTAPAFLAMSDLGFATAAGVRMTITEAQGKRNETILTFQSAWVAILLSSCLFAALAVVGIYLAADNLFGHGLEFPLPKMRLTLLLLLLYGIAAIQGSIFTSCFRCAGLYPVGAFLTTLTIIVETCVLFCVVLFFKATPTLAAAGLLAGRCIGILIQVAVVRRMVPWLTPGFSHARLAEIRQLLAPAGAVMLLPISQALMLQGTAFALGAAAGESAVPAFTAARTLSRLGLQLVWAAYGAIMPEMSAAIGRRDRAAIATIVWITVAITVLFILPFAAIFGLFGRDIILIWSGGVINARGIMIGIMTISVLACGFWTPLSQLLLSADRSLTYSLPYIIMAILVMPATYLLAPHIGPVAPALAVATVDVMMLIVVLIPVNRHLVSLQEMIAVTPRIRSKIVGICSKMGLSLSE